VSEKEEAIALANKVLDEPYRDPDDDLSMMSRQFLRALEAVDRLRSACEYAAGSLAQVPYGGTVPPIVLHDCKEKLQGAVAGVADYPRNV